MDSETARAIGGLEIAVKDMNDRMDRLQVNQNSSMASLSLIQASLARLEGSSFKGCNEDNCQIVKRVRTLEENRDKSLGMREVITGVVGFLLAILVYVAGMLIYHAVVH